MISLIVFEWKENRKKRKKIFNYLFEWKTKREEKIIIIK